MRGVFCIDNSGELWDHGVPITQKVPILRSQVGRFNSYHSLPLAMHSEREEVCSASKHLHS